MFVRRRVIIRKYNQLTRSNYRSTGRRRKNPILATTEQVPWAKGERVVAIKQLKNFKTCMHVGFLFLFKTAIKQLQNFKRN